MPASPTSLLRPTSKLTEILQKFHVNNPLSVLAKSLLYTDKGVQAWQEPIVITWPLTIMAGRG